MKVLIDGNEVECKNDVKIIFEDEMVDFKSEKYGELHITLGEEGMIADTILDGKIYKSSWRTLDDIIGDTV